MGKGGHKSDNFLRFRSNIETKYGGSGTKFLTPVLEFMRSNLCRGDLYQYWSVLFHIQSYTILVGHNCNVKALNVEHFII